MPTESYQIGQDARVYFVTYSIVEWLPVFTSEPAFKIVTDSPTFCQQEKGLRINALVVMPTHFHAIFFDADLDNERLQRNLADFRKFTGRKLSDFCSSYMPNCFAETLRAASIADRERRFWQPSRHPEGLVSESFWRQKLDYLHDNPVRKGLVTRAIDWRFSSAAWYVSDGDAACDVPLSRIDWA